MIVVGIITILAGIALPAYQDYTVRAKMSEVILALSSCRTSISEIYQSGGSAPGMDNWGCESAVASKYVAGLSTSVDGSVTATVQNMPSAVNGKSVTMTPLSAAGTPASSASDLGKGLFGWRCGAAADGTNVGAQFLPGTCR